MKKMLGYYSTVAQCENICSKIEKQIKTQANKIARIRGFKNFEEMNDYYTNNEIHDEFCMGVWGAIGNIETMYENCGQ